MESVVMSEQQSRVPYMPQSDHDLLIELMAVARRMETTINGLENRLEVHVADIDKRMDSMDDRLHIAERLLWAITWVGGPAWGIVLLLLGAMSGAVAHSFWPR